MAELTIENRGTEEVPFGFVYHMDTDGRAYFVVDHDKGEITVGGPGSGYFKSLDPALKQAALVVLARRFGKHEVSV